jgi:hypothetical protein
MSAPAIGTWLAVIGLIAASLTSRAHEGEEGEAVPIREVIGDVGEVSFPISCGAEGAQARFDRGVALLHHMTYEVAEREFAQVAAAEPACAMAHWGIAMTVVRPVWPGLPTAEMLARGAAEIARARALPKTEREAAYVEALAAFYDDWEEVDHWTRIRRCVTRLLAAEIPVVAACTGHAIAAGAFLLLAADTRVGSRGAYRVGFNETAIGLPFPGWGRELARARLAREHVERATRGAHLYPPGSALEAGFLDELVEPADLMRVARERAGQLAREGREAYAARVDQQRGALIAAMERRWRADFAPSG